MKIDTSPPLLIIEKRPWIIGGIFLAVLIGLFYWAMTSLFKGQVEETALALLIGAFVLVFAWIFVRRVQLILNGVDGTVILRKRTMRGYSSIDFELPDLNRAIVESIEVDDGSMAYRMVLHVSGGMDAGTYPFTDTYYSGGGADRAAKAVNDWLVVWRASDT